MTALPYQEVVLVTVSKNALKIARDHAASLAAFGIDEAFLTGFESDIQSAESVPSDFENRIDLKQLTQTKDDLLDECYIWGCSLKLRMEMAFGKRSDAVKNFPSRQMHEAVSSEKKMIAIMEGLLKLADQYQEQLLPFGQTAENCQIGHHRESASELL